MPITDVLDLDDLLARLGGDEDLLIDVVGLFLGDAPPRLAALERAVIARDAQAIRSEAHGLKGAAANMSAARLVETAGELEEIGMNGNVDAAPAAWTRLSAEGAKVLDALRQFELEHAPRP